MKRLLVLALLALLFDSCTEHESSQAKIDYSIAKLEKRMSKACVVVVFDSCEYVVMLEHGRGYMAHKGNCKFCAKRARRAKLVKK